jgi:hypothetical protein
MSYTVKELAGLDAGTNTFREFCSHGVKILVKNTAARFTSSKDRAT